VLPILQTALRGIEPDKLGDIPVQDLILLVLRIPDIAHGPHLHIQILVRKPSREPGRVGAENDPRSAHRLPEFPEEGLKGYIIGHPSNPLVGSGCIHVHIRACPAEVEKLENIAGAEVRYDEGKPGEAFCRIMYGDGVHVDVRCHAARRAHDAEMDEDGNAVACDYDFWGDDDGELKPGVTMTREVECPLSFVSLEFYATSM